jgi:hypothetical protein
LLTCALAKGRLIYPRQYHQRVVYNPPRSIFLSNHIGAHFQPKKKEEEEEKFEGKKGPAANNLRLMKMGAYIIHKFIQCIYANT